MVDVLIVKFSCVLGKPILRLDRPIITNYEALCSEISSFMINRRTQRVQITRLGGNWTFWVFRTLFIFSKNFTHFRNNWYSWSDSVQSTSLNFILFVNWYFIGKILDTPWRPPWLVLRTAPWQFLWLPRMHFTATALWLVKGPNTGEPFCVECPSFICVAAVCEWRSKLNFFEILFEIKHV